jgi:sulfoxide reductase heme-binding subunit YedZ
MAETPVNAAPSRRKAASPQSWLLRAWAKPLLFVACLLPLAQLVWGAATSTLGANPAEALIRATGDWTLRLLCVTLAVTPLRQWGGLWLGATRTAPLARFRRMLGLFAFLYGGLHLLAYGWLDMGLVVADMARDIVKRPFILVGFAAMALMLPLAATSFNAAIRALGARHWQTLHKLVYLVVGLGLLHFWWMRAGKNDFVEPSVYVVIVAVLMAARVAWWWRGRRQAPATPVRAADVRA